MEERLESIKFLDFKDPRPKAEPIVPDSGQDVSKSVFDGSSSSRIDTQSLTIVELWLRSPNGTSSRSCVYPTDRRHADIAQADPTRFLFRVSGAGDPPVDPNDAVNVCWRLRNAKTVKSGLLELFIRDSKVPVWTKTLSKAELQSPPPDANATDQQRGTLFGGWAWNGTLAPVQGAHQPAFPGGHLLAAKSPYKLKLTVFTSKNKTIASRQAWTYFDVPYWHKYKLVS
jgi:hypothetical protein